MHGVTGPGPHLLLARLAFLALAAFCTGCQSPGAVLAGGLGR